MVSKKDFEVFVAENAREEARAHYLQVMRLPGRIQQALVLVEGNKLTPVAYFKQDAAADFVRRMIDHWVSGGSGFEDLYIRQES